LLLLTALGVFGCADDFVEGSSAGDSDSDGSTGVSTSNGPSGSMTAIDMMTMDADSNSGSDSTTGASMSDSQSTSSGETTTTDPTDGDTTTGSGGETESDTGTGTGEMPCDSDELCDDTLVCNGAETCVGGECQPGTPVACDDGIDCTVDACDENAGGVCAFLPQDSACSNDVFCDGAEVCDPDQGCLPGTAVSCDDDQECTVDTCDEDANACAFTPDHDSCQNGTACDGAEVCSAALGCIAGTPLDCNDSIACTADSCEEPGGCVNAPNDAMCGDGVFCDGDEVCTPGVGCQDGAPIDCGDDGIACTVEACNEATDACTTTLDNMQCNVGEFCTTGGCFAGDPCDDDTDCDDGAGCNGLEFCDLSAGTPGVCSAGTPIGCDDGVGCTVDTCAEPGTCENTPLDGLCADANQCNGAETCDPVLDCQDGPALDCDDGVACTADGCAPASGCLNVPQHFLCEDDSFCNGAETCNAVSGCQAGMPVACGSDGIACTLEQCSDALGCHSVPDDSLCGCGETCQPSDGGCSDACNVATCDGMIWQCGNCMDDDGDCMVDSNDPECFGPCDNNESGFKGEIPGQNQSPCKHDCYFDDDSGSGNDDCYWSHECDPLEPSAACDYDPDANIPGSPMSCDEASATQSMLCEDICGPLVPNGCDCFGCCEVFLDGGGSVTVFLGSQDAGGDGSCSMADVEDPNECHPCTQVPACLNTCEGCEICFGQDELPPGCTEQDCSVEQQPCGLIGQDPCPVGEFCLTGCCVGF
jgi:hypothetical protein